MKKFVLGFITTVSLTVALLLGLSSLTANATSSEQFGVNETWRGSWDGTLKYLYLDVDQTGYYDFSITDNLANAGIILYMNDMDLGESVAWNNTYLLLSGYYEEYSKEHIYLIKDHVYQIRVIYGDYDSENEKFDSFYADISINFTKTDYSPETLSLGATKNLFVGEKTNDWFEFKTSAAGDYLFALNEYADFNLDVYEKDSGKQIKIFYFDYYKTIRLSLKANTKYIIKTSSGENSERLVRLSLSKAASNIEKIDVVQEHKIRPDSVVLEDGHPYLYYSDFSKFKYLVTYSNNSKATFSYSQLRENGVTIDLVKYTGKHFTYRENGYLNSGNQSVQITYMNGKKSNSSIYVTSYVELLTSTDTTVVNDYRDMVKTYQEGACEGYWLIKPDENNNYEIYSSEWHKVDIEFTIFDQDNNVIPSANGYNLKAGQLYSIKAECTFRDYYSNGFSFAFEPNREHTHSYSNSCDKTCNVCSAKRTITHDYKAATCTKAKTCKVCGATSGKAKGHAYTNACDKSCNVCKATRTVPDHKYSGACDKSCNVCGKTRSASAHKYTNSCDTSCNVCKAKRTITHSYKTTTTKATISQDGKIVKKCSVCNKTTTTTIKYAKTFKLSKTSYTYNGKVQKPTVTVKDSAGKTISSSNYTVKYSSGCKNAGTYKVTIKMKGNYTGTKTLTYKINAAKISSCKLSATSFTYNGKVQKPTVTVKDSKGKTISSSLYTVTYSSGCKNPGVYKVTVKGKGDCTGSKTITFKIFPAKTTISNLSSGKNRITVNISKKTTQVTGYQIQYATSKNFTNATKKTISSNSTTKYTLTNLSTNKTYYVRVRTYKKVGNTLYCSGWSSYKTVKTK